ncbi:MAG TPA: hypothetical protein DEB40_05370 [Elusimicrobia bacterium]|nr:hypothetical protein [Elusimicrobiota bacterium]HBT61155.1 hypothetical protein [Elusimicrobiota bacterium]
MGMDDMMTTATESLRQSAHDCGNRRARVLGALAAAFFLYGAASAGGFKSMAKELSRAAHGSGIIRVAVIPFEPADSSSPKDGRAIAEKLTTQLVRTGRVQTVERSLIGKLLDEHSLAKTGLIDQGTLKKLGAVLSVDGIVSGSFVTLGSRVLINARLINLETGLIVAACEREAPREWFDGPGLVFVPAPEMTVEPPTDFFVGVPRFFSDDAGAFRDSVAEDDCAGAADRVDRMESNILELKARYWALRLKKGLLARDLKYNPGSIITDPQLKKKFYDRMTFWYRQDAIPALTITEVGLFVAMDKRAFALHRRCGI